MLNAGSVLINAGQVAKCIATVLYAAIAVALIVARNFLPESPH
jgi:hypothetical protein